MGKSELSLLWSLNIGKRSKELECGGDAAIIWLRCLVLSSLPDSSEGDLGWVKWVLENKPNQILHGYQ